VGQGWAHGGARGPAVGVAWGAHVWRGLAAVCGWRGTVWQGVLVDELPPSHVAAHCHEHHVRGQQHRVTGAADLQHLQTWRAESGHQGKDL
jgi:hypothetical protein